MERLEPVFNTLLPRIADELSKLTEEDTNAIIHPCLAMVVRENGKQWTPVFRSGELMFDDIDLFSMLQLDAYPESGLTLDSLPDGEDYLMRPVDAGYIPYSALKDGSVDLADIARMNDWLDLKADNEHRIARWREANER